MGKLGQEYDVKSQLVSDICSISKRSVACIHRRAGYSSKSQFIDWYHILGVEEDAGHDVTRKHYRRLALQLHPDKNKHPKAEIAFKLVSEAYTCLSDDVKRKGFDLERQKRFCTECITIPYINSDSHNRSSVLNGKASSTTMRSKSFRIFRGLKDIRDKFKEETRVIENCLRVNNATSRMYASLSNPSDDYLFPRKSYKIQKELPIFDPSNYQGQGYPHVRTRIHENQIDFWYLQTEKMSRSTQYSYPVFETRQNGMFRTTSACLL